MPRGSFVFLPPTKTACRRPQRLMQWNLTARPGPGLGGICFFWREGRTNPWGWWFVFTFLTPPVFDLFVFFGRKEGRFLEVGPDCNLEIKFAFPKRNSGNHKGNSGIHKGSSGIHKGNSWNSHLQSKISAKSRQNICKSRQSLGKLFPGRWHCRQAPALPPWKNHL